MSSPSMTKALSAMLVGLVWLGALGCGSSSDRAASGAGAPAAAGKTSGRPSATQPPVTFVLAHTVKGLRGDEEDDDFESKTEGTVSGGDTDADNDNETVDNAGRGYYERDDAPVRGYGRAATPARERALVAVLERYFRAGLEGDGAVACSLLTRSLAASAVEDYGHGSAGPSYLQSARSCPQVVVAWVGHVRGEVTGTIYVAAVRVSGKRAYVLLGSKSAPASYVILERQAAGWRLSELVPAPLP